MKAGIGKQNKHFYEFGPFRVDAVKRRLRREGQPVPLTPKAFDMLLVLLERRGQAVEKDELIEAVWPGIAVEENNLTQNIYALRKALGDSPNESRYILTVPGWGYRFVADVRELTGSNTELVAQERTRTDIGTAEEATNGHANGSNEAAALSGEAVAIERKARWQTTTVARVSLMAIFLAALTFALYAVRFRPKPATLSSPINSIVVLPLENLSGDPTQEYFADGMTDALIGELAKIGALRVISRTSAMYYKGMKKTLPQIAAELKVDAAVEGTVARFGDRARVHVQLIRAAGDQHLWSETFDYDLRDVLAMQSEVARTVAHEIQIKTTPDELARLAAARPVNRKAYNDYLLGIHYWNRRTEHHLLKAIDYFNSAIREDEAYAPAYAALADCNLLLAGYSFQDPREYYPRARDYAARALAIDGNIAEAHTTLAAIKTGYEGDWAGGEQEHRRAIELSPGSSTAHMRYSFFLAQAGRIEASLAEIRRALELDPVSPVVNTDYGRRLYIARRFDEAIEQLRKTLDLDPNFYMAHLEIALAYAQTGRYVESLAELETAAELSRDYVIAAFGYVYAISGRRSKARHVLAELHELSRRRYVSSVDMAAIYTGLGEKDQAFAWLEKAFQERESKLLFINVEPKFESLRKESRFGDLLRRIGLIP